MAEAAVASSLSIPISCEYSSRRAWPAFLISAKEATCVDVAVLVDVVVPITVLIIVLVVLVVFSSM
jgi:hypothetical protein